MNEIHTDTGRLGRMRPKRVGVGEDPSQRLVEHGHGGKKVSDHVVDRLTDHVHHVVDVEAFSILDPDATALIWRGLGSEFLRF